jgi:2-dehydropantoate 2-reductase
MATSKKYKILIYGAGVLGCYLAHRLIRAGNDLTLLARGDWKRTIDEHGLVVRHYVQMKTTVDRVKTIDALAPEDVYDIVFVMMQCTQLPAVLPALAANRSSLIVFVGNNTDPVGTKNTVCADGFPYKQVLFGFQTSGGRRENGRVICVRAGSQISIGGIDGDNTACAQVIHALGDAKYSVSEVSDMDAWLKSHLATILPLAYAVYACGGNLRRADGKLIKDVIAAVCEGFEILRTLGIPPLPAAVPEYFSHKPRLVRLLLWLAFKTPVGRLAMSDHAMSAIHEMDALNVAFAEIRQRANIAAPAWDALEKYMSVYLNNRKQKVNNNVKKH